MHLIKYTYIITFSCIFKVVIREGETTHGNGHRIVRRQRRRRSRPSDQGACSWCGLLVVAAGSEKEKDKLDLGLGFDSIVKEMFGFS